LKNFRKGLISALLVACLLVAAYIIYFYLVKNILLTEDTNLISKSNSVESGQNNSGRNPLKDKKLFVDSDTEISNLVNDKKLQGKIEEAKLLNMIASQPQAIWLTGPTAQDTTASRDTSLITRTSQDASEQKTIPIYVLYAIPYRDICAGFSGNSITDNSGYLLWIDKILNNLQSEAIFIIEPDAIAHAVMGGCLDEKQTEDRFTLLNQISNKLGEHNKVIAAYLDAGHSEWFPNSTVLIEPLKMAGLENVRGIVINVSFFEPTKELKIWAQQLLSKIGNSKAVIIDTSRNGNGLPPDNVKGIDRWCNPRGRAIGQNPSTQTESPLIDAYLWVKRPGESDGTCGGNPPAGVLSESIAIELAKNSLAN
jgi:endoglucanase